MSTVVYLSNQQIQVVEGTPGAKKISVQKCYSGIAPEGSIINGMVMDPESFAIFMKEFWETNKISSKDVILVINSTKFIGKNIEAPEVKGKKLSEFIEREFSDLDDANEYVFGYIPLVGETENKMKKYYAERVDEEFLQDYLDLFKEIGVPIKAVYSGESSLIALTERTAAQKYKTFVLEIADKMNITTLLWVDGSYYYFNSTRCFHDQGTEEYCQDVARSVSQINQFMKANQIESPLECVMLAGVAASELPMYQEAIEGSGFDTKVEVFDNNLIAANGVNAQNYFHGASGLIQASKSQNFIATFGKKPTKTEQTADKKRKIVIVCSTVVAMLLIFGVVFGIKMAKQSELEKLEKYNNSPAVQKQAEQYDVIAERNDFLTAQYNAIQDVNENIYSYPLCNKKILDVIFMCSRGYADVEMESFDAEVGIVQVKATAKTVKKINRFIAQLNKRDIFNKVDYTGYTYDNGKKVWDIHVICTLAEAAGRKGAKK